MIDLDHLERQTAGDTALQQELIWLFLTQIEDVQRLIEGSDTIEPLAFAEVIHRLRGAALAVGALSLAASLSRAETSLGTSSSSADAVDAIRAKLREAHCAVARLLPR